MHGQRSTVGMKRCSAQAAGHTDCLSAKKGSCVPLPHRAVVGNADDKSEARAALRSRHAPVRRVAAVFLMGAPQARSSPAATFGKTASTRDCHQPRATRSCTVANHAGIGGYSLSARACSNSAILRNGLLRSELSYTQTSGSLRMDRARFSSDRT